MRTRPTPATLGLVLAVAIAVPVGANLMAGLGPSPGAAATPTLAAADGSSSARSPAASSSAPATLAPSTTPTTAPTPSPTLSATPTPTPPTTPTPPPNATTAPAAIPTPTKRAPTPAPAAVATPTSAPTPLPPTAIVAGAVDRTSLALSATYDVDVRTDWDSLLFAVDSTASVTNTSGDPIDRIELNTLVARLGNLKLDAVTVDGRLVAATIDDQTIVVPLGGLLPDGATAAIRVAYRATLRTSLSGSSWMFTRANGIIDAYRWLPWVSRRVRFDRPNHGDPFVTPVSPSVTVRITTDRWMGLATTGERIRDDGLTQTFRATNVRDFVITASPTYRSTSAKEGTTTVRIFYRAGAPASAMIDAARDALRSMEALVGPYPYSVFNVAQSAGGYGMEGPGIIWIPTGVASGNLRYLVHHETAHQWFYGVVGGDQAAEPFTDEAVTDFLARYVLGQRRASTCSTGRLDLTIYDYSAACYYETIYIQGGNLLDEVRAEMGTSAFFGALRGWVDAHRFGIAPTLSLLDALDASTGIDLPARFAPRFPRLY